MQGFTAEWLVDSISGLTETGNISKEFVALILLPLVGKYVLIFRFPACTISLSRFELNTLQQRCRTCDCRDRRHEGKARPFHGRRCRVIHVSSELRERGSQGLIFLLLLM